MINRSLYRFAQAAVLSLALAPFASAGGWSPTPVPTPTSCPNIPMEYMDRTCNNTQLSIHSNCNTYNYTMYGDWPCAGSVETMPAPVGTPFTVFATITAQGGIVVTCQTTVANINGCPDPKAILVLNYIDMTTPFCSLVVAPPQFTAMYNAMFPTGSSW